MAFGDLWLEADYSKVKHGRQRFDHDLLSALGRSREPDKKVLISLSLHPSLSLRPGDFVLLGNVCLIPAKENFVFGQFWVEAADNAAKVRQILNRHVLSALRRCRELEPHVLCSLRLRPGDFVLLGNVCLVPVRDTSSVNWAAEVVLACRGFKT